jgi:Dyp-type peroxidase family
MNLSKNISAELLNNLQANILKHHGRSYAWHLFLQFTGKGELVKKIMAVLGTHITPALKQLEDAEKRRVNSDHDGGILKCLYLSKSGYEKLGVSPSKWPKDIAFREGLARRGNIINDPKKMEWEEAYQQQFDALLLLADSKIENLQNEIVNYKKIFLNHIRIGHVQKGEILRNEESLGIEHFGYVDGISQPEFLTEHVPGKKWDPNASIKIVLVNDPGINKKDCLGSYFVFRKLEQNVKGFKEKEEELGEILFPAEKDANKREVAGAYIVGRFENSTPVTKHAKEIKVTNEHEIDNDFNYENDNHGSRCPFHAHIRMTNPRKGSLGIPGYKKPNPIVRRGIPYDEAGRHGDLEWFPEKEVGLLFMCFQSSIVDGFELMQQMTNLADGIIGQKITKENQLYSIHYDNNDLRLKGFSIDEFVSMKGGEYFFAPSIPFIKNLK